MIIDLADGLDPRTPVGELFDGLMKGMVGPADVIHFAAKPAVYLGYVIALSYGSYRLWKAAQGEER